MRATITADAFYLADHTLIFQAIEAVAERCGTIDAVLVKDELRKRGTLDDVGGVEYLCDVLRAVPSAANGPHYAQVVAEKHRHRRNITIANELIAQSYAASNDPAANAAKALNELLAVSADGVADRVITIGDAAKIVRENLTRQQPRRIATGITRVDDELSGLPIGKFIVVGGRPGMGKSLFAKQIAHNVSARGTIVGIVSIEEDRVKIAENAAAMVSGIDNRKINAGHLTEDERDRVLDALDEVANRPFEIIDDVYLLRDVESAVTTLAVKHQTPLVIVDHIHLIDVDEGGRDDNETRKVTKISRRLKALGKRLGIALVVLAQLNRGNEHRAERPQLKDIRESGSIEQDGDLIILLHREDYYHRDEAGYTPTDELELLVRKNKDGRCSTLTVTVDLKTQSIINETSGRQSQIFQPEDDDAEAQRRRVEEIFG